MGVLVLIIGPIILFSTLNPIKQSDVITSGELRVTFSLTNKVGLSEQTNSTLPLFATQSVSQITTIDKQLYDAMHFEKHQESTGKYDPEQIQVV